MQKMAKMQFQKNDNFELEMNKIYSPVISKKIYYEYSASFAYHSPLQIAKGSDIYKIISTQKDNSQFYEINLGTSFCTCLKLLYLGIPCRHIYSLWRFLGKDLILETKNLINTHWNLNINKSNTNMDKNSPINNSKELISVGDIASQNQKQTLVLGNIKIKNTSSKKRPISQITSSPQKMTTRAASLKKVKFNKQELFNFIKWSKNSCSFDSLLATIYFMSNKDASLSASITYSLKILSDVLLSLNNKQFQLGQEKFIEFLKQRGLVSSLIGNYLDVQRIIKITFGK